MHGTPSWLYLLHFPPICTHALIMPGTVCMAWTCTCHAPMHCLTISMRVLHTKHIIPWCIYTTTSNYAFCKLPSVSWLHRCIVRSHASSPMLSYHAIISQCRAVPGKRLHGNPCHIQPGLIACMGSWYLKSHSFCACMLPGAHSAYHLNDWKGDCHPILNSR